MNTLFIGFYWLLHQQLINNNKKIQLFTILAVFETTFLPYLSVCLFLLLLSKTNCNPKKKKTKTVADLFTFSAKSIQVVCFAAKLKPSANFVHSITVDVNCVSNVLCLAVIAIGFSFLLCCFSPLFTIPLPL